MFFSVGLDLYYNNLQALKGVALSLPSMRHGGLWAMWTCLVVTGLLVICCSVPTLLRKSRCLALGMQFHSNNISLRPE